MKNLTIYTGPAKNFSDEDKILAKIQIDNSLNLGWRHEDLLLVTDFPFEYNGIKSLLVPDGLFYNFDLNANKIPVIIYLIKNMLIENDELYWCHDLDAYELNKIDESELRLSGFDLGLTHYTYKPEWQCGSLFFKSPALDIFELIDKITREKPHSSRNNEKVLTQLIAQNAIDNTRYKRLNVTYNIMKKYLNTIYPQATKPLKVLHFRPSDKDPQLPESTLAIFMYGKNSLKIPLMNDRLINIFHQHGIK